jgi:hypothetical protein
MKFSKSVRIIQGAVRDFLACKKGRILALERIWDAYEHQFILTKCGLRNLVKSELEAKALAEVGKPSSKLSRSASNSRPSTATAKRAPLENEEMKNERMTRSTSSSISAAVGVLKSQEKRWSEIDFKFNEFVGKQSTGGMTSKQIIEKYVLPKDTRYSYFTKILDDARSTVVQQYKSSLERQKEQASKKDTFSLTDAAHLLSHSTDEFLISRVRHQLNQVKIFQSAGGKGSKCLTFIFYKMVLDENLVCKCVRKAHEVNKTFVDFPAHMTH